MASQPSCCFIHCFLSDCGIVGEREVQQQPGAERMPKQKRPMPEWLQDEEVAKLQKDLKRARQFNTDSHSEIVSLLAELNKEKEKNRLGGSSMMEAEHHSALQQLRQELRETKNAVNRLESKSIYQQQMLLEAETAKGRLDNEVRQLHQRLCHFRDDGTKEYEELCECLQQAFCFMNAVLDDGGNAAQHAAPDDLLQQGTNVIVGYLGLVRRREGTDRLLEELRKALPPKKPASSSRAASGKIRSALLQYHPDKHAGAGRWIRVLCERVTKLLNELK